MKLFCYIFTLFILFVNCTDQIDNAENASFSDFLTGTWEQYEPNPFNNYKYYHIFTPDKTMYSYMVSDGFLSESGDTIAVNENHPIPYEIDQNKIYRKLSTPYSYKIDKDTLYLNTFGKADFNEYRNKYIRKRI